MHAFAISDVVTLLYGHLRIGARIGANRSPNNRAGAGADRGTAAAAYGGAKARA
jgi:hypothetical protein